MSVCMSVCVRAPGVDAALVEFGGHQTAWAGVQEAEVDLGDRVGVVTQRGAIIQRGDVPLEFLVGRAALSTTQKRNEAKGA